MYKFVIEIIESREIAFEDRFEQTQFRKSLFHFGREWFKRARRSGGNSVRNRWRGRAGDESIWVHLFRGLALVLSLSSSSPNFSSPQSLVLSCPEFTCILFCRAKCWFTGTLKVTAPHRTASHHAKQMRILLILSNHPCSIKKMKR